MDKNIMGRPFSGGGGGGSSSGMLRSVHRAVRASVGEPFSSSSSTSSVIDRKVKKNLKEKKLQKNYPNKGLSYTSSSSSSTFSSLISYPVSGGAGVGVPGFVGDDLEWECIDGDEYDDEKGSTKSVIYDDFVFGSNNVPSRDEVCHAVSALQQVLGKPSCSHLSKRKRAEGTSKDVSDEGSITTYPTSSSEESESDWIEPSMHLYNSRMLQTYGSTNRVYDAFHLMQTEPSVQRMVVSLSSDKAIWDAVMNNEVVKELRGSIAQANNTIGEESLGDASEDDSNTVKDIVSWIVVNSKAKLMQLVDSITKIFNGVFQPLPNEEVKQGGDNHLNLFDENLKTSLLLSVVVLLIVVITRAQSA